MHRTSKEKLNKNQRIILQIFRKIPKMVTTQQPVTRKRDGGQVVSLQISGPFTLAMSVNLLKLAYSLYLYLHNFLQSVILCLHRLFYSLIQMSLFYLHMKLNFISVAHSGRFFSLSPHYIRSALMLLPNLLKTIFLRKCLIPSKRTVYTLRWLKALSKPSHDKQIWLN